MILKLLVLATFLSAAPLENVDQRFVQNEPIKRIEKSKIAIEYLPVAIKSIPTLSTKSTFQPAPTSLSQEANVIKALQFTNSTVITSPTTYMNSASSQEANVISALLYTRSRSETPLPHPTHQVYNENVIKTFQYPRSNVPIQTHHPSSIAPENFDYAPTQPKSFDTPKALKATPCTNDKLNSYPTMVLSLHSNVIHVNKNPTYSTESKNETPEKKSPDSSKAETLNETPIYDSSKYPENREENSFENPLLKQEVDKPDSESRNFEEMVDEDNCVSDDEECLADANNESDPSNESSNESDY